jgi:dipeptidase E
MLILTSNGISSEKLFDKTKELIKENMKSVALIPTASNEREDKEFNILRHTEIFARLGLSVEIFDIDVQNPKLLDKYDVIFLMGGNPFYLLEIMRKTNCKELFSSYIKSKIIIGASAGSIVFGNTLGFIYEVEPELNDRVKLTDFTGLCLTDSHIFPHASTLINVFDRCLERLDNFAKCNNIKLIYLEDGQAVFDDERENIIV